MWWDPDIHPGETWDEVIERELDAALCVTVLWSRRSIRKEWVRAEATEGLDRRILVPALIEEVNPPLRFRHVQAAPLMDWKGEDGHRGFERLLKALSAKLGAPPRPQTSVSKQASAEAAPEHAPSPPPVEKKSVAPEDLADFAVFRDFEEPWCPEMVALPGGAFMMGSPDTDKDADDDEKPRHKVTIATRFAIGCYPVTFEEYDRFCGATGRDKSEDEGWGRGRRPLINVSWDDAKAYVAWLGAETGKSYRLLSEAEWEYACRAGTTTRYSCGDTITEEDANFDAKVDKTTEVGSYPANLWGLYDMHGNVWEWLEDVWHDTYKGARDDGGAWTTGGDSDRRVVRGGSWYDSTRILRSALRVRDNTDNRYGTWVAACQDHLALGSLHHYVLRPGGVAPWTRFFGV